VIAPADDIDRIMAVMNAAFDPAFGEAWSRRQVEDALILGNCHYRLVAVPGAGPDNPSETAGFFLSRFAFDEEELLLVAVNPAHRRRGTGTALLKMLFSDARKRGAGRILLEMRKGNPAESLYRSLGFAEVGNRPNYYRIGSGSTLDAVTFACRLDT
jgi:ribosomal-protein-alanine N-acetyltransferase